MTTMSTSDERNLPGSLAATVSGVWTVAAFQLRRLLTRPRLAMAAIGAVFPAAVMLAADRAARRLVLWVAGLIVLLALAMEGAGAIIAMGVKVSLLAVK